jgi:hypothetical protein
MFSGPGFKAVPERAGKNRIRNGKEQLVLDVVGSFAYYSMLFALIRPLTLYTRSI